MSTKKVRLFVVEGPSDETSYGLLLKRLIVSSEIDLDVFHSDIFGRARAGMDENPVMREANILKRVDKEVTDHIANSDYDWKDLQDIVLITDTDGCFVSDALVEEDPSLDELEYCLNKIVTPNRESVIARNCQRSANIMKVVGRGKLVKRGRNIPLAVYYMSRNLEHAFHDEAGYVSDRRKAWLAREFASRYKRDPQRFIDFLRNEIGCAGDYHETWSYVREGAHSLERGSNLHLLFEQ